MEKSYLRYRSSFTCGLITSPRCNIARDPANGNILCGSSRDVACWDVQLGSVSCVLHGEVEDSGHLASPLDGARGEVVALAVPESAKSKAGLRRAVAAAYAGGMLRVWRGRDDLDRMEFDGHRGAVSLLRWCPAACSLCSGGANGDVLVWDAVAGSGSCRLRGHTAPVTDGCFVGRGWFDQKERRVVVTAARDALIKVWDVDAEHCTQTVVCEDTVRGIDCCDDAVAAAGEGSELQLWRWSDNLEQASSMRRKRPSEACAQLRFSPNGGRTIATLTSNALEVYRRRDPEVAERKAKKRRKKRKEEALLTVGDEWEAVAVIFPEDKPRSFTFEATDLDFVFGTRSNTLERHRIAAHDEDPTLISKVEVAGYRSAVRSVSLSADAKAVAAASMADAFTAAGVKLWAAADGRLLRSVAVKKALVVRFMPGDLEVLVGCKDGKMYLVELASGVSVEAKSSSGEVACAGALWTIGTVEMSGRTYALSGGVDPELKLWRRLKKSAGVKHCKSVRVGEDVLCVRYVSNAKYAAVATMDACVRVLFADTLKFKATLYGHSLSVLCLDGTKDAELLATGSADKSLKLWGLEFAELRRSTLAHDDAITALDFIGSTHYIVTASKDGAVKMWDSDNKDTFVQTFKRGHISEVWALATAPSGNAIYTAGADRSLRAWLRTDEPVFPSEEIDIDLEARQDNEDDLRRERILESAPVVARPGAEAAKSSDRLANALELALTEDRANIEKPSRQPSILLLGKPTHLYILHVLSTVKSPDLEPTILVLPLHLVATLLDYLNTSLTAQPRASPSDLELCARCANVAVSLHHRAVLAHRPLATILASLRTALRDALAQERYIYGANLAAIRFAALGSAAESPALTQ